MRSNAQGPHRAYGPNVYADQDALPTRLAGMQSWTLTVTGSQLCHFKHSPQGEKLDHEMPTDHLISNCTAPRSYSKQRHVTPG